MKKHKLAENRFGTGAMKSPLDLRDRKWKKLATASAPFDWQKGYDVEHELAIFLNKPGFKITVKDQGANFSCSGQAGSYYESVQDAFEKGVYTEKSARYIYSQIFHPGGGASTRDVLNHLIKKGVCLETLMPSYTNGVVPMPEAYMHVNDSGPETVNNALTACGTGYAFVRAQIDDFAQAIRDNHGLVFTISGQNNGTWRSKFPEAPTDPDWNHELYAGKAVIIKGKKYIGFLNSWGSACGEHGWQYIGEEYFNTKFIYDAGVLYDESKVELQTKITLLSQLLALMQQLVSLVNARA